MEASRMEVIYIIGEFGQVVHLFSLTKLRLEGSIASLEHSLYLFISLSFNLQESQIDNMILAHLLFMKGIQVDLPL
jgi:hypothetical protein